MIYLVHPSGAFAVCEHESGVAFYEARGFVRCSHDELSAAWAVRDAKLQAKAAPIVERARAVNDPYGPLPWERGVKKREGE